MSNPVVGVVAGKCSKHKQRRQQLNVHCTAGGNRTRDEQQRISGQEGCYHQAGFTENNQKQNEINPVAVILNKPDEMLIQVQDDVDESCEKFQSGP